MIAPTTDPANHFVVFSTQTPLPALAQIPIQLSAGSLSGNVHIFVGASNAADAPTRVGELSFTLSEAVEEGEELLLEIALNQTTGLNGQIQRVKGTEKTVVTSLDITIV